MDEMPGGGGRLFGIEQQAGAIQTAEQHQHSPGPCSSGADTGMELKEMGGMERQQSGGAQTEAAERVRRGGG